MILQQWANVKMNISRRTKYKIQAWILPKSNMTDGVMDCYSMGYEEGKDDYETSNTRPFAPSSSLEA